MFLEPNGPGFNSDVLQIMIRMMFKALKNIVSRSQIRVLNISLPDLVRCLSENLVRSSLHTPAKSKISSQPTEKYVLENMKQKLELIIIKKLRFSKNLLLKVSMDISAV